MSNKMFHQSLDDKKLYLGVPFLVQMLFKKPVVVPDKEKNPIY